MSTPPSRDAVVSPSGSSRREKSIKNEPRKSNFPIQMSDDQFSGRLPTATKSKNPKIKFRLNLDGRSEANGRISNGKNTFQIGVELGRGAYGVVLQAFNVDTGDFVAVKRLSTKSADSESIASIEAEIQLMQKLSHPNIVKYISTIRSKNHLYIVLEYMENGSLADVLKKYGSSGLTESLTIAYTTQVLTGLIYLHGQGVLHRDIKAANILTNKGGQVKLADFGVARTIKLDETSSGSVDSEFVGSPYWMAPEIIDGTSGSTTACDIWSVGCTVTELLTSRPPYSELVPHAAMYRIVTDDYPPLPKGISQGARNFLLLCFYKEPTMRHSADKLITHPWLASHPQLQHHGTTTSSDLKSSDSDITITSTKDNNSNLNSTTSSHINPNINPNINSNINTHINPNISSNSSLAVAKLKKINSSGSEGEIFSRRDSSPPIYGAVGIGESSLSNNNIKLSQLYLDNNDGKKSKVSNSSTSQRRGSARFKKPTVPGAVTGGLEASCSADCSIGIEGGSSPMIRSAASQSMKLDTSPVVVVAVDNESMNMNTNTVSSTSSLSGASRRPLSIREALMKGDYLPRLESGDNTSSLLIPYFFQEMPTPMPTSTLPSPSSEPPPPLSPSKDETNKLTLHRKSNSWGLSIRTNSGLRNVLEVDEKMEPEDFKSSAKSKSYDCKDDYDHSATGCSPLPPLSVSLSLGTLSLQPRSNRNSRSISPTAVFIEGTMMGQLTKANAKTSPCINTSTGKVSPSLDSYEDIFSSDPDFDRPDNNILIPDISLPDPSTSAAMLTVHVLEDSRSPPSSRPQSKAFESLKFLRNIIGVRPSIEESNVTAPSSLGPQQSSISTQDHSHTENTHNSNNITAIPTLNSNSSSAFLSPLRYGRQLFKPLPPDKYEIIGISKEELDISDSPPRSSSSSPSPDHTQQTQPDINETFNKKILSLLNNNSSDNDEISSINKIPILPRTLSENPRRRPLSEMSVFARKSITDYSNGNTNTVLLTVSNELDVHITPAHFGFIDSNGVITRSRLNDSSFNSTNVSFCDKSSNDELLESTATPNNKLLNYKEQTPNIIKADYSNDIFLEQKELPTLVHSLPNNTSTSNTSDNKIELNEFNNNMYNIRHNKTSWDSLGPSLGLGQSPPLLLLSSPEKRRLMEFPVINLESYREAASRDSLSIASGMSEDIFTQLDAMQDDGLLIDNEYDEQQLLAHGTSFQSISTMNTTSNNLQMQMQHQSFGRLSSRKRSFNSKKNLTDELKERMKRGLEKNMHRSLDVIDNLISDFVDVQDLGNEVDIQHNKKADVQIREVKEMLHIMSKIKPDSRARSVVESCDKLIEILTEHPDRKDHLMNHYGVMPILDMFEARSDFSTGILVRHNVLKVVNKFIEGHVKIQEQLSLVGIIPPIMRVLENGCRNCLHNNKHDDLYLSMHRVLPRLFTITPVIVEPLVLEAAKFVHQISSTSSLTFQMLIGAGGLNVLVQMVAFSSLIIQPGLHHYKSNSLLTAMKSSFFGICRPNSTSSTTDIILDNDSTGNNTFSASDNLFQFDENIVTASATCVNQSTGRGTGVVSEDATTVVYLGIDCINQVFTVHSSRSRDFCRLFVKLGLLPHLSSAFVNIMYMYHKAYITSIIQQERNSIKTRNNNINNISGADFDFDNVYSNDSLDGVSAYSSATLFLDNEADKSEAYKYALTIATIFLNFSRSNAKVAEHMAKSDGSSKGKGNSILETILMFLQSPALRDDRTLFEPLLFYPSTPRNNNSYSKRSGHNHLAITSGVFSSQREFESKHSLITTLQGRSIYLSSSYLKIIINLLKCVKNLSMESTVLSDMERAGTIPTLVPLLNGPIRDKCKTQIFPCIFNLCRINKMRQEQAAACGIVPHLQLVITGESHLRQLALPIFCSMAHASPVARKELWKYNGVGFFINLLKENYWQTFAFNALATWLKHDSAQVEQLLIQQSNISKIIDFFRSASAQTIRTVHNHWLDMMTKSPLFTKVLGVSGLYISALLKRLKSSEAVVLCSLLKMLRLLHQFHASPRQLVLDNDLYRLVLQIAQVDTQVLVSQVANSLLIDFQDSTMT